MLSTLPAKTPLTAVNYHIEDFTEAFYATILDETLKRYRFVFFDEALALATSNEPVAVWRHDVDFSLHRAVKIAEIEASKGIQSTYYMLFHSEFYGLMERPSVELVRRIASLGHRIGLHFDPCFYDDLTTIEKLESKLSLEKMLLEDLSEQSVTTFSYHNPTLSSVSDVDNDVLAGMVNTYGKTFKAQYKYCSDSNGYWRYDRLIEVIQAQPLYPRLQVLTHPVWWTPEVMTPRERISLAIDGRSAYQHHWYDDFLASQGRLNIGAKSDANTAA